VPAQVVVQSVARNETRSDPAGHRLQLTLADQRANLVLGAAQLEGNLANREWCWPVHARSIARPRDTPEHWPTRGEPESRHRPEPAAPSTEAVSLPEPRLGTRDLSEEPIEASRQADPSDDRADREERPGDVWRRRLAGVVADAQPFTVGGEDDLGRDDEAREPYRVNL
jgi:hypothetical protein